MQKDVDRYGRIVAICRLSLPGGSTLSLNDWLVRQGLAVAYRRAPRTVLRRVEECASQPAAALLDPFRVLQEALRWHS